jgi:molybdenum cofactor biosynthesis enzyme
VKVIHLNQGFGNKITVNSLVSCDGKTGVEMEAITAVSITACTIYDMCKAVNKAIEITDIKLIFFYLLFVI